MNRLKCAGSSASLVILLLTLPFISSQSFAASDKPHQITSRLPLSFEQNLGQTDARVRYLARNGRFRMYLTQDSTVLDVAGPRGHSTVIRTSFAGAHPDTKVLGVNLQRSISNYLLGSRPEWKTALPHFCKGSLRRPVSGNRPALLRIIPRIGIRFRNRGELRSFRHCHGDGRCGQAQS